MIGMAKMALTLALGACKDVSRVHELMRLEKLEEPVVKRVVRAVACHHRRSTGSGVENAVMVPS